MAEQTERRAGKASWRNAFILEVKHNQGFLIRICECEWHLKHKKYEQGSTKTDLLNKSDCCFMYQYMEIQVYGNTVILNSFAFCLLIAYGYFSTILLMYKTIHIYYMVLYR